MLHPDPGTSGREHEATLHFDRPAGDVSVQVINTNGTALMQNNYEHVKTKLSVAMPPMSNGLYLIRVRGDRAG
jgi:hypothetical protein